MANEQDIQNSIENYVNDRRQGIPLNTRRDMQGVEWDLQGCAMMTRTCYLEFHPLRSRAKLSTCFVRVVGPFIHSWVILQDPEQNQIQVSVERKNCNIYLSNGWSRLKDFYGLHFGGWVTMLYLKPFLFFIKVRTTMEVEVTYPRNNPPVRMLLPSGVGEGSSIVPLPWFVAPTTFHHILEKTLTFTDVTSGILALFWSGFCQLALPDKETELTMIDWLGNTWKCCVKLSDHDPKIVQITGEWRKICKSYHLIEGITIKFGVTESSHNKIIHFKISPFICVRTTLLAPTTTAGYKAFYQAEHYFML